MTLELGTANEYELDEQHQPLLAVRVGQRFEDGSQDRDGVGGAAAECEPHCQVARRLDAQRRIGRMLRDAREHLGTVVLARVP